MATETAAEKGAETTKVVRSYFDAVARQDLDAMESHYGPGAGGRIHGLVELRVGENYREWFGNLFRAFPDWKFEVLDVLAEGDRAVVEWRARGTFTGDVRFEGMEANGASLDIQGCDLVRVRDGKMVDNQSYSSGTELARQLGALPPQGSVAERGLTTALNLKTRAVKALRRD